MTLIDESTETQPTPERAANPIASARNLLIAWNAEPTIGRPTAYRLGENLSTWFASETMPTPERARELGVPRAQLQRAQEVAARCDERAAREQEKAERLGARLLTRLDEGYPRALLDLALAPPVLTVRGEIPLTPPAPTVAIVGSRRASPYGREVAETFARALASHGVVVVSGFARGVDHAAHRGALAASGGRTFAILGCGLGIDYPSGHAGLGDEIASRGAMISEFPCFGGPRTWHFPVRNRVIAALAGAVLVVQAAARSGSLVTARHALDLGREVFAIPGEIFDDRSLGPHALLRDGAALALHPRDLLDCVLPNAAAATLPAMSFPEPSLFEPLPGLAGEIQTALWQGPELAAEELADQTGASVDRILTALLELEIAGLVVRLPGAKYRRG